jgi:cytochrome c oxidase cbb3-type subunit 2
MIRPFRDEVERYGHYSLAAESMYDHPFQWGSKRSGPDLARVGGRYSDDWQREHLINPRAVVPESIMPAYPFLMDKEVKVEGFGKHLAALNLTTNNGLGAMYSEDQIANAEADLRAQASADGDISERYPKSQSRDYDGQPGKVTEMDALIAYLQMLGTLVDFSTFTAEMETKSR